LKSIELGIHQAWDIKKHIEKQKNEKGESKYASIELNKIYSVLSYTKKLKAIGSNLITTDNIFDVCNKYADIGNYEKKYFILGFSTNPVMVLINSQTLMKRLIKVRNLHVDETYIISTCSYPLIVVGFTDLESLFYLIALCIVVCESAESYK
jgi:hypothetical protein